MDIKNMAFIGGCILFLFGLVFGCEDQTTGLEFLIYKLIALAIIIAGCLLMTYGDPTKKH